MIPEPDFVFDAELVSVIDGDTFVADVSLGYGCHTWIHVRIHGVDAPEHNTPEGPAAADYLGYLLGGRDLRVKSYKDRQSFARWVCDCWVKWPIASGYRWDSVAQRIIDAGHGVAFMA